MTRRGKPYLGTIAHIGMHGQDGIHGMMPEQFCNLVSSCGEPFLFSSVLPVCVGTEAHFFDGTRGVVSRLSTREEFLTWEQRLFPGCKTILGPEDRYFVEVRVD
jgi:hypothetical protein